MKPERVVFHLVVYVEAIALATGGRWVKPWTHFLLKLTPAGRFVVSALTGVWMLRHLDAWPRWLTVVAARVRAWLSEVLRHPRGRVLP